MKHHEFAHSTNSLRHKALSNSNLNDFDAKYDKNAELIKTRTTVHSATNLLDISNEELPDHGHILAIPGSTAQMAPPRRPPPPVPAFPSTLPKKTSNEDLVLPLVDISPIVDLRSEPENQIGFEDDFSRVSFSLGSSTSNQAPPPLPPLPSNIVKSKPPLFTLDSTESDSPFPESDEDPFLALASASANKPISANPINNSKPQLLPPLPPLPPMPPKIQNQSSIPASTNSSFKSYIQPQQSSVPPPLPPPPSASLVARVPPPLPQRPPSLGQNLKQSSLDPFGDPFFNIIIDQQQNKHTTNTSSGNAFDPFA
jgi:hypothetical protein